MVELLRHFELLVHFLPLPLMMFWNNFYSHLHMKQQKVDKPLLDIQDYIPFLPIVPEFPIHSNTGTSRKLHFMPIASI